ncbi:chromate transporter [Bacillus sinesaloumensis]|uniref:chromate transporter n=1 Tax=Litchfieldia sinesaloumensis TaxID=1926280 RepID=UPI0009884EF3|nr:chromate transporter [Bacillus sinesaloumensis]
MKQLYIFYAFFKVGILGYGGGPSSIPLVHKEAVDRYKWLTDDDFGDILALGNTLPGPIATKMAGYIGYRVGGWLGMINAVLATTIPTIILMIILLTSLTSFKDLSWVQGMTKAVLAVVGVMLAQLTWEFLVNAKKGLGWIKAILLVVISVLALDVFGVHPGIVVGVLLAIALLKKDKQEAKQE